MRCVSNDKAEDTSKPNTQERYYHTMQLCNENTNLYKKPSCR